MASGVGRTFASVFNKLLSLDVRYTIFSESSPVNFAQIRGGKTRFIEHRRKPRVPYWYIKKDRHSSDEALTTDNKAFIKEVLHDKYGPPAVIGGISTYQQSPLKIQPMERGEWNMRSRRTGLIAKKIGIYPMWLSDGSRILTTLLQVVDNHVINYIPPDKFDRPIPKKRNMFAKGRYGCLVVGAESSDPQLYTKEYCGMFTESGIMPKKILSRFIITPDAAIQPGTPLYASHFQVGEIVDVAARTIYHGFQGVVKRWGFKGGPASHGNTKTHRRGGNIGGGGEKGRVWPGTKMPGHMGGRRRILRGLKIWRINTKYNVIYVQGPAVPGPTNSYCFIYDSRLLLRKLTSSPNFPTYYPEDYEDVIDEDIHHENLHQYSAPTITFEDKK